MNKKKLSEYNAKNSNADHPSDLVGAYLLHEEQGGTLYDFLKQYDFDTREEIAQSVRELAYSIAGDRYLNDKDVQRNNVHAKCVAKRFSDIVLKVDKFDKYPNSISGELWHGGYSRQRLNERTKEFFSVKPNAKAFNKACEDIKKIYSLSDSDINKLHFFVEQVKAGASFPNSLRRMLYIWGVAKMTGKTTSATMLTCLLNGDDNENNISHYSTSLAVEMQIKTFAVPKISECNAALMDECFYSDMGKTYADFKRFITSSNGSARLPFGQSFEWEGQPNYIATSNDSLQKFIKDWGDRRYLAIEFKAKPTQQLSFEEIKSLWRSFVINSQRVKEWKVWADELAPTSNEIGERQERANEFEIEMCQKDFLDFIFNIDLNGNESPANPQNHISLKKFVDYFATHGAGQQEANKRRGEIESAVLKVFGARYGTQTYWLATTLKAKAKELNTKINGVGLVNEELPFQKLDYGNKKGSLFF